MLIICVSSITTVIVLTLTANDCLEIILVLRFTIATKCFVIMIIPIVSADQSVNGIQPHTEC